MKRILFYSESFCGDKSKGGLEIATFRIANSLKKTGEWEVFDAYKTDRGNQELSIYTDAIRLSNSPKRFIDALADFIKRHNIDVVVNMTRFSRHKQIVEAARKSNRDVRIFFSQRFAPGSERKKKTWSAGMHLLKLNPWNPLYWLRATIYPLLWLNRNRSWAKLYRYTYENSDRIILQSEGYFEEYRKIAGIADRSKFLYIPNIFSREEPVDADAILGAKKNRVLVLSRMDEIQKRVSLALKIWSKVEQAGIDDWHLDIVGTGHDVKIMKRLAKKLRLKNVTFHGWRNPKEFVKVSKILMHTSEYEGLPSSVIEAQAYGCVPVAFDAYAAIGDLIDNGINGVLVKNFGDIDTYASKLIELMKSPQKLESMARDAIKSADKYNEELVGPLWNTAFKTF